MVSIGRVRPKSFDSPKGEVGEIDTSAPFQSVKAAVSLFREVATSRGPSMKKIRMSAENVLDKETQFILAQRELNKYKQQLESAAMAKSKAVSDLEKAKITMKDLNSKLQAISHSKNLALEVKERVKKKIKELELEKSQNHLGIDPQTQELSNARSLYKSTAMELDAAKQELAKLRQEFDSVLEMRSESFQRTSESQQAASASSEKASELSKQVKEMKESCHQLNEAMAKEKEKEAKLLKERSSQVEAVKATKVEAEKKIEDLKRDYDSNISKELETTLVATTIEIEVLQEEMKRAHAGEMEKVRTLTSELNEASSNLEVKFKDEDDLRKLLDSLGKELKQVKTEQLSLLIVAEKEERKQLEEQNLKLEKLLSEVECTRREAAKLQQDVGEIKKETENARLMEEEAEKNHEVALRLVDEAKATERDANEQMKILSAMPVTETKNSSNRIQISLEEFNSLKNKIIECAGFAEAKEAEALAKVEEINVRRSAAESNIEMNLKSIQEIIEATDIAVKTTEMAESAQSVVEVELRKWRDQQEASTG